MGAVRNIWPFRKPTESCALPNCQSKSSIVECGRCGQKCCEEHTVKQGYLVHLPKRTSINVQSKPLCISCVTSVHDLPKQWERSFVSNLCAHMGCDASFRGIGTSKNSCKVCGLWYCSSHSEDARKISGKWLSKKARYPDADTVCSECAPIHEKRGFWEDLKSVWRENRIVDMLTDTYLLVAFRIVLIGLSLMILVGLAPTTFSIFNNESITAIQKLWNLFLCGIAFIYLGKEVIWQAIQRPKIRPYAITFCIMAVGYVGYRLMFM